MSTAPQKIMVISGVVPCDRNVGGIILGDICDSFPEIAFVCFSVCHQPVDKLPLPANVSVHTRPFANEWSRRPWVGRAGTVASIAQQLGPFRRELGELTAEMIAFGRNACVDAVWQIVDTPSLIAMGPAVAEALGVPLYSLVWDHPDYISRNRGWDRFSRGRMSDGFRRTLAGSQKVAVVSSEMVEEYGRLGARQCVILRHGFAVEQLRPAKPWPARETGLTIGFAGSLYASSAWESFVKALDLLEWQIGEHPVTVRLLGSHLRLRLQQPARIECLGWRDNNETLDLLAGCDLNYLPLPFEPELNDLARLSFPTKLSTYAAAGVPVFVHAPEYSSLVGFYAGYPLGALCSSLDPQVIAGELTQLILDAGRMRTSATQVVRVAREELNLEVFRSRFARFMGLPGFAEPEG